MASAEEIREVRQNTDEPTQDPYTEDYISALIDQNGINRASEIIWLKKAAGYAHLVDVSEAGASHAFSNLHKNALSMAAQFKARADSAVAPVPAGATTIGRIVR